MIIKLCNAKRSCFPDVRVVIVHQLFQRLNGPIDKFFDVNVGDGSERQRSNQGIRITNVLYMPSAYSVDVEEFRAQLPPKEWVKR